MKPKKLLSFILTAIMAISLLPVITPNVSASEYAVVQTGGGIVRGTLTEMIEYAQKNGYGQVFLCTNWTGDITIESGYGAIAIHVDPYEFNGNITVNKEAVVEIYGALINDDIRENGVITNNGMLTIGNCTVRSPVVNKGELIIKDFTCIENRLSVIGDGNLTCEISTDLSYSSEIKQLYVLKTNDGTPRINLNRNAPRIYYIKSEANPTTLAPLTLSELIENGRAFKYKEEWVDGTLTELGDENGTDCITVEYIPSDKAAFATNEAKPTVSSLTYDGTEQNLVNAGTSSEGTVKYALSKNGQYFETVPTGKNADDYTVWYYIAGDSTHFNSDKESIDVKIKPKNIAEAQITLGESLTYDGTEQTKTISKVEVDGLNLTDTDYTVSNNTGTEAKDDYVLTITGKGNFTGTATTNFAIAKADSSVTTPPTKAENLTYTGDDLTLLTADGTAEGGTIKYSLDGTNFDYDFNDIPKVKNADDYKIWYKVIGDANHNDTAADFIEIKVAKKPINSAITLTAPAKNAAPQTSLDTDEYAAAIAWTPTIDAGGYFAQSTQYSATITITPKANYTTDGITAYTIDGAESVNLNSDGTVTAVFPTTSGSSGGGGGSSASRYTVKFNTNGGDTITSQTVKKNSKATEPTKPTKEGYIFDGWYSDSKFTTEYDFDTKVTKNTTLYAKWIEDEAEEPSDDKNDDEQKTNDDNDDNEQKPSESGWENPFTDVSESDWFFDNVKYANENGLMSGITNAAFAPNLPLTRGMLVTILYRLAGEPAVNKSIPFADVKADSYYANAVIWAQQNGIVSGINENEFAPDENITREQIAVILYRYAKAMGYDVSVGEDTNILSYNDFDDISEYAIEAVQYAVGSGLMNGKTESTLNPRDNATRAEIAAILNRFIENNM